MESTHYFPSLHGKVDCSKCDKSDCMSRGKHQRDRLDFTYTSGRCPRLPDIRGFVEESERVMYSKMFPLVYVERVCENSICLTLTIPGIKRGKRVYYTKICGGYWYFRDKVSHGYPVKRVVTIENICSKDDILHYMDSANTDYCVFRCDIEDYYI